MLRAHPKRVVVVCALAVALGTTALWAMRRSGPYLFDDWTTPVGDPASQSVGAFFGLVLRTLRPLTKLTYALESSAGLGERPEARRLVSDLILGAESALVFTLIAYLRTRIGAAILLSLLVVLHPLNGDSVWLLAGRSEVLSGAFLVAACVASLRGRSKLSAGLFVLACLARETAVFGLLPLALVAWSRRRGSLAEVVRRLDLTIGAAFAFGAYLTLHARYQKLLDFSMHARPLAKSAIAQVAAIPTGLSLAWRIDRLSIDHGEPIVTSARDPSFLAGVAILAGLAVLAIVGAQRRAPRVALGASLALAALLPTQSFIPKLDPLTEKPFAFALVGFALLAAELGAYSARALPRSVRGYGRSFALGMCALGAIALGRATLERGKVFERPVSIWADAASKSVSNARPYLNLALCEEQEGNLAAALEAVEKARAIDPFDPDAPGVELRIRDRISFDELTR
jgi:hypothetical protein